MEKYLNKLDDIKTVLNWTIQGLGITGISLKDSRNISIDWINMNYNTQFTYSKHYMHEPIGRDHPKPFFIKELHEEGACLHIGRLIDVGAYNSLPSITGDYTKTWEGFCCDCDEMVYAQTNGPRNIIKIMPWITDRNIAFADNHDNHLDAYGKELMLKRYEVQHKSKGK